MTKDEAIYVLKNTAWLGSEEQEEKVFEAVRMAVEALKTQLPKEGTTSDCISRQAAIDICNNVIDLWQGQLGEGALVAIKNAINNLPSVQPERTEERTETHACDCVSRQAVIDALRDWYDGMIISSFRGIEKVIKALPSVQPEVLACGSGELNVQSEPQWIPCRETVDIPDHEILACDKYGEEMFGYLSYEDDQWLCETDGCMMYDPIAWREKPEPYQEGE